VAFGRTAGAGSLDGLNAFCVVMRFMFCFLAMHMIGHLRYHLLYCSTFLFEISKTESGYQISIQELHDDYVNSVSVRLQDRGHLGQDGRASLS
jgi:hypothetical protein